MGRRTFVGLGFGAIQAGLFLYEAYQSGDFGRLVVGEALVRKHRGKDALFTAEGYQEFADDLLERMTNPYLQDTVERVGRDPHRKLGWDDRLIGTMRVALQQKVRPYRYAMGAAAALARLEPSFLESAQPAGELLEPIWGDAASSLEEKRHVLALIDEARKRLNRWHKSGFQDIHALDRDIDCGPSPQESTGARERGLQAYHETRCREEGTRQIGN